MEAALRGAVGASFSGDVTETLQKIAAQGSEESFRGALDAVLQESVSLSDSRPLLMELVSYMQSLPAERYEAVAPVLLEKLEIRAVGFNEAIVKLREDLGDFFERAGRFRDAANCLAEVPFVSAVRSENQKYLLEMHVRVANLLLRAQDIVRAEGFLERAGALIGSDTEPSMRLRVKVCNANISDAKLNFTKAAQLFLEAAQADAQTLTGSNAVTARELERALHAAVVCACLARPSAQRSRILAQLIRDSRAPSARAFPILEKMYHGQLIRPDERDAFVQQLENHHRSPDSEGRSPADRSLMEHNIVAVSRVYEDISFDQLATILGTSPEEAEDAAARMSQSGQVAATVDQVDAIVRFAHSSAEGDVFDEQIARALRAVARVRSELAAP